MRAGFGCATASDGGAAATVALALGAGAGARGREDAPQASVRLATSGEVTARTREDQWLDIRNVTVQQPLAAGKTVDGARPPGSPRAGGGNASDGPTVAPPMSARLKSLPRDLLFVLVMSATLFVARASLADHYVVPSGSMEPTVAVGDHVCVNKLAYGLRVPESEVYVLPASGPARGDVVVLDSPADGQVLLKRVVAVPGDRVAVNGGRLTLDGVEIATNVTGADALVEHLGQHTHAVSLDFGGGPDLAGTVIPAGRYLVLGDNRGNSRDGRYFGLVARGAILGRAEAVCIHDGRPVWRGL
jgi:signal peptidase I